MRDTGASVAGWVSPGPSTRALDYPAAVGALADAILAVDRAVLDRVVAGRAPALTPVMRLASRQWVKSVAIPALGVAADLARSRRGVPPTLALAAVSHTAATLTTRRLKRAVARARPSVADPAVIALVGLPRGASFPSDHAATAFATAGVVAALHPALRAPALGLAATVALSRVYLGVHHPVDVVAGAALGAAVAAGVVAGGGRIARGRLLRAPRRPARMPPWTSAPWT